MSRTPDNEDLPSGATRGNHDGGMAEILETAWDAEQSTHIRQIPTTLIYLRYSPPRNWHT